MRHATSAVLLLLFAPPVLAEDVIVGALQHTGESWEIPDQLVASDGTVYQIPEIMEFYSALHEISWETHKLHDLLGHQVAIAGEVELVDGRHVLRPTRLISPTAPQVLSAVVAEDGGLIFPDQPSPAATFGRDRLPELLESAPGRRVSVRGVVFTDVDTGHVTEVLVLEVEGRAKRLTRLKDDEGKGIGWIRRGGRAWLTGIVEVEGEPMFRTQDGFQTKPNFGIVTMLPIPIPMPMLRHAPVDRFEIGSVVEGGGFTSALAD